MHALRPSDLTLLFKRHNVKVETEEDARNLPQHIKIECAGKYLERYRISEEADSYDSFAEYKICYFLRKISIAYLQMKRLAFVQAGIDFGEALAIFYVGYIRRRHQLSGDVKK